jgi:HEAT repeat protein
MESGDKVTPPTKPDSDSGAAPDRAAVENAKEILNFLAHTVTSMKLFPSHHATVVKFVDDLFAKLESYFENRQELEVDVLEDTFFIGGEAVYKEANLNRSLPYLFFKDGMKKFAILKEIDREELGEFLEVIRQNSLLPLDESDIVLSIWEKDLVNIRILAPDEFVLSKIDLFAKQIVDFVIDRDKLFGGKIELSASDLKDIQSQSFSLGLMEVEEKKDYAELVTKLDDQELNRVESMLAEARQIPPEQEFLGMIFELLYLEERIERFAPIVGFLERHQRDLLQQGKFIHAAQFVTQIRDLKDIFSVGQPAKAAELGKLLDTVQDGRTIALIRQAVDRKDIDSLSSFFDYLSFLGSRSIPLASELLDETQEEEYRRAAVAYLEKVSGEHIETLADQLQEGKPALSREIIALLGRSQNKKVLTHLAALQAYANKDLRLAAIDVISSFSDPLASRILFGFFQDADEDVRTAAADRLEWQEDKRILQRIIRMVSAGHFHNKSAKEKTAILNCLARTRTPEALKTLRRAMQKSGLLFTARRENTRLCAVLALEAMGTPEALEVLRAGRDRSGGQVSEACREALERIRERTAG